MLAVISAGKNNSYGHPRAAVIKQLMFQNVQIELVTEDATLGLHEVFLIKA
jgi:beta-lactamase superfamily II metal-dependent hydrolase